MLVSKGDYFLSLALARILLLFSSGDFPRIGIVAGKWGGEPIKENSGQSGAIITALEIGFLFSDSRLNSWSSKGIKIDKSRRRCAMSKSHLKTIAIIFSLSSITLFSNRAMALRNIKAGQELKNHALTGLAGETIELQKNRGKKATLMIFWASWSPRSLEALADFQKLYAENGTKGDLEIIAVNVEQQSPSKAQIEMAKSLADEAGVKYKLAMDENLSIYNQLGVVAVPSALLTDKNGKILEVLDGYPPDQSVVFKNKTIEMVGIN